MISVKFTGLDVFAALSRPERLKAVAHHAVAEQAEQLADAIREAAPSDKGDLKASVRVEPTDDPLRVIVTAGGTPGTIETNADGVQFDEALMSEYGTSRSAAQPFFWPTVESMRDTIKANIDGAMEGALEE
jgi:hypothetical protein